MIRTAEDNSRDYGRVYRLSSLKGIDIKKFQSWRITNKQENHEQSRRI